MYLDESLDFEYHVSKIYSKSCSKVGLLKKIRPTIDHSTALTLYKSLILPHLDDCDTVYMTANVDVLNKLQLVQNVACRTLLLADKYANIDDMHRELDLMTLNCRRNLHLGNLCHKAVHSDCRTGVTKFFKHLSNRGTRVSARTNIYNVVIPDVRSNFGRKSLSYRGPYFWNVLSNDLKNLTKSNSFIHAWVEFCKVNFENHPT